MNNFAIITYLEGNIRYVNSTFLIEIFKNTNSLKLLTFAVLLENTA